MPDPVTLTDTEKAYLAEIIGCADPDMFGAELLEITTAQETILKADIALWQTVRDDFDTVNGGKSGIHTDPADTRRAIKRRVVRALDVQYIVDSVDSSDGGPILSRAS